MTSILQKIVAELSCVLKLNGDNYEVWQEKVQYLLQKLEILETISNDMEEPEAGNTAQQRRDLKTYEVWREQNRTARIILLSAMNDSVFRKFQGYQSVKALWVALKKEFNFYSTERIQFLTMRIASYKRHPEHSLQMHIWHMVDMIDELRRAGHIFTPMQKLQVIIHSLPDSWRHVKMQLSRSNWAATLEEVQRILKQDKDRHKSKRSLAELQMATSSKAKRRPKRRKQGKNEECDESNRKQKTDEIIERTRPHRVQMAKRKCYSCNRMGHYSKDCTAPKHQD